MEIYLCIKYNIFSKNLAFAGHIYGKLHHCMRGLRLLTEKGEKNYEFGLISIDRIHHKMSIDL